MAGLKLWHEINDLPWCGSSAFVARVRHSAEAHAPPKTKPPRPPITLLYLEALRDHLNFNNTFDSAVYAVATIAFWSVCRLGELTVPSLSTFSPRHHVQRSVTLNEKRLPNGRTTITFHIPWSKTTLWRGADLVLTEQLHRTSPIAALRHHMLSNAQVPGSHGLFSYMENGSPKFMTKTAFLERCRGVWADHGLGHVDGHSFRIGGSTELVRRGLPLDMLQMQGRWTSDAFKTYLRRLDEILSNAVAAADDRAGLIPGS